MIAIVHDGELSAFPVVTHAGFIVSGASTAVYAFKLSSGAGLTLKDNVVVVVAAIAGCTSAVGAR